MSRKNNTRIIGAVVFDWAGTTVDYGCFAPVDAFLKAFREQGITMTIEETRAPMGLAKRNHIEKMLENKGLCYNEEYVSRIYSSFEHSLFNVLKHHCDIIPGVIDVVEKLREMKIKVGSTTGYTKEMMDIVVPAAKSAGYAPDSIVCPEDVKAGRPFPYMLWKNLENLGIESISEVVKIGDTEADIKEGTNAGCISIGVLKGSSMVGLSIEEELQMSEEELLRAYELAKNKYIEAGADYVINEISELPQLIEFINREGE